MAAFCFSPAWLNTTSPSTAARAHIFYEHWVQLQLLISETFTEDFAAKAMERSEVREAVKVR